MRASGIWKAVVLALALAGCRFEADRDFLVSAQSFDLQAFSNNQPLLVLKGTDPASGFVLLRHNSDQLVLAHTDAKLKPTATYGKVRIATDPQIPTGFYFLIATTDAGAVHYYVFGRKSETEYVWLNPKSAKDVGSLAQLRAETTVLTKDQTLWTYFDVIGASEANRTWNEFVRLLTVAEEKKSAGQSVSQQTTKPSAPTSQGTGLRLEDLDIGEGIYVQGIFSDELVRISRIDLNSRKVKVLRSSDGTGMWVHESDLLSREQSTANNIGRVAVGVGVMVCIFSPETCKSK